MGFASDLANLQKTISSNNNRSRNNNSNNNSNRNNNSSNYYRNSRYHNNNNNNNKRQRLGNNLLHDKLLNLSNELNTKSKDNDKSKQQHQHVALLFIIINELPFEQIWKKWISTCPSDATISVLIHAKHPERIKSTWIRQHLILEKNAQTQELKPLSYRPEWGSIEITRAMIELVSQALNIGDDATFNKRHVVTDLNARDTILVNRFIFVSETCLPLVSSTKFYEEIYKTNQSWCNMYNTPNNGYSRQLQWDQVSHSIPSQFINKSDQWIVLTRTDALLIIRDVPRALRDVTTIPLYFCFQHVKASDEIYFATVLAILNSPVYKQSVTYCDWSENSKNPKLFDTLAGLKDVIQIAHEQNCLFGRKFSFDLSLHDWANLVLKDENHQELSSNEEQTQDDKKDIHHP